ncbi:transducin/WD40 repeat-like superfamily protein isoform X2 [Wolffia australiana]
MEDRSLEESAMATGGRKLVSSPPVFSEDGTKLLVCTGTTVSIYSISTGLLVAELEGHTELVTSVVVVPMGITAMKFSSFCWTASLDGTISHWDFSSPELIRRIRVGLPIYCMVIPRSSSSGTEMKDKPSDCLAFISVEDSSNKNDEKKALCGQIKIYNLTRSKFVGGLLAETRKPEIMAVSKSGEYVGIRNKRKLHVWKIPVKDFNFNDIRKIKLHHTKNLTTLAFHPNERLIAAGDVTGRILLWKGFGKRKFSDRIQNFSQHNSDDEEERPGVRGDDDAELSSTWHWHPAEVKILQFSPDGEYLYSGGKEGVLVLWHVATGKKRFLPRIGSALLYFAQAQDPSLACISCTDNQIQIVNMSSTKIVKSISGIKLPFPFPRVHGDLNGFAFDRAAGVVALRTEAFSVQLFSLFHDAEISQIQVCERNYQPVDDVTMVLALLALSRDGSVMGTVEVKLPEEEIGGLVCLKFWMRGSQTSDYSLETVVYEPHSEQKYQKFQKSGWRCRSVGSYKRRPMTAAAFCPDGSVLAVAAEGVVTLWDPDTNILVSVIGQTTSPITDLAFTGNSNYLIATSRGSNPQLAVWEMTTLSLRWSYKLSTGAISSTENGSHFAVLALSISVEGSAVHDEDGLIILFEADRPSPVAAWHVRKARLGGLAFLQRDPTIDDGKVSEGNTSSELLVFINGEHEYVVFDPFTNMAHQIRKRSKDSRSLDEKAESYGYASIYGELPEFKHGEKIMPMISSIPSDSPWESIFNGPSHALPPLTKLCSTFLASLLQKNTDRDDRSVVDADVTNHLMEMAR